MDKRLIIKSPKLTLIQILRKHDCRTCKVCGRKLDRGDISWRNAATEYGTGYSTVEIVCQQCDTSIAHVNSWYECDDFEDASHVLRNDW